MVLETVPLGQTGLSVSELALGTWRFGRENDAGEVEIEEDRAHELLDAFADRGGTFIDTANSYGDGRAEEWIGEWLADRDRDEYVVASKIYWPTRSNDPNASGLNRKHLRGQIDCILDRLETSYLDLLYVHRWDDATPAAEYMRTLNGFVEDGRVNYLGTSTETPNAWKVVKANELARQNGYEPFSVAQPRYNLLDREIEARYLPMCRDYSLGIVPWSPLAGGFLTGKYGRDETAPSTSRAATDQSFADRYFCDEHFEVLDHVKMIALEVGATPAQVSLAWLLHQDAVTAPIVGARTVDQLEENVEATAVTLTAAQRTELREGTA
ncbi:aldo/keto reductase [Natrinema gelatinilyticum]|uniref:aldo/keto reductase n=1 Tax=Natrinema gelatinilyticum TaxID=2961571 RepID=UPI0020C40601|nr:aldo/keto reductase [Natrinema gelatinilyticum]